MKQRFELQIYNSPDGAQPCAFNRAEIIEAADRSLAKAKAGRIARRTGGPVDIAYYDDRPWNERYMTTAAPCEYSAQGYRLERIG